MKALCLLETLGPEDAGVTKQGCDAEATSGQTLERPAPVAVAAEGRVRAARQDLPGFAVVVPRTGSFRRRVIYWMKEEQAVLERHVPAEPEELWTVAGFPDE